MLVLVAVEAGVPPPLPLTHHQDSQAYYQAPHHPHYGYGDPKYSCKVANIVKEVEVCTPEFETVCESEEIRVKKIVDKEICFPVARTVCTESVSVEESELCTFSYSPRTEQTEARGVEVSFTRECAVQSGQQCARGQYGQYGHHPCEETGHSCHMRPLVSNLRPGVQVTSPGSDQACVTTTISLPSIHCLEDTQAQTCVTVPGVINTHSPLIASQLF